MIVSKNELKFYIAADRIMAGMSTGFNAKEYLNNILRPNFILKYLRAMRYVNYYTSTNKNKFWSLNYIFHRYRFRKLGIRLGFSIGHNSFGYGLFIPHYGTIVINNSTKAGNYCVLHTSTCIGGPGKTIGDALYLSSGALIMGKNIVLGNSISIAANSMVNCSFPESSLLLTGTPAIKKSKTLPWYDRDGEIYKTRIKKIEELKNDMGL